MSKRRRVKDKTGDTHEPAPVTDIGELFKQRYGPGGQMQDAAKSLVEAFDRVNEQFAKLDTVRVCKDVK